jgi:hypothetical protein
MQRLELMGSLFNIIWIDKVFHKIGRVIRRVSACRHRYSRAKLWPTGAQTSLGLGLRHSTKAVSEG